MRLGVQSCLRGAHKVMHSSTPQISYSGAAIAMSILLPRSVLNSVAAMDMTGFLLPLCPTGASAMAATSLHWEMAAGWHAQGEGALMGCKVQVQACRVYIQIAG